MYLSINLLGLFVRGLFTNPELEKLKKEGHDFIKQEIEKDEKANKFSICYSAFGISAFWGVQ